MELSTLTAKVESVLPAMCELVGIEALKKTGYSLRADIEGPLRKSVLADLKGLRPEVQALIGQRAMRTALDLLKQEDGDARHATLAACMFAMKLVDEGLLRDPKAQSVLVGLLILAEAQEDDTGGWGYDGKKLQDAGGRLLSRAKIMGLYQHKQIYMA